MENKEIQINALLKRSKDRKVSKKIRRFNYMKAKALELGFESLLDAEMEGYGAQLEKAFNEFGTK
jgi:hypothetical protein